MAQARAAVVVGRWFWSLAFGILILYVVIRMGGSGLSAEIATGDGAVVLPNTFASVDHPFHVARAETLWRELSSGQLLRWIGQHQGGYPVEFYPLGEAWLEVAIRALTLGAISATSTHTIAVIVIFLMPGLGFLALARLDGWSPAVALLALSLHLSLPGGWYDGGYTELVQWGLVTNVAGAVLALLMLPALIRFLATGAGGAGALAAALAAGAIYTNPRSLVGLLALGGGAWLASTFGSRRIAPGITSLRLAQVASLAALLAAPELVALARFGDLYTFVQYSGYDSIADYAATAASATGLVVIVLAISGAAVALFVPTLRATRSAAASFVLYVAITLVVAFVPQAFRLASQLEPTRLMPLQRLLTIYLAAAAVWMALTWLGAKVVARMHWLPTGAAIVIAVAVLAFQTRPLSGPPPDPASPAIPAASLYPVTMSAAPEQVALEVAVRSADAGALPGTALLVLGSALSWHQQLWAPLWTTRPLYYDNWLWYWHPDHVGTPGYHPAAGHHYPDPERSLDPEYLQRHGIGAVVVTGPARETAAASPNLRLLRQGLYDAYVVVDPVTTITFGEANANSSTIENQRLAAEAISPGSPVLARANWHPRWAGTIVGLPIALERLGDGSMEASPAAPADEIELRYGVQAEDWLARGIAGIGVLTLAWIAFGRGGFRSRRQRWYSPQASGVSRRSDDLPVDTET